MKRLSRGQKRTLMIIADIVILPVCLWLAFCLRLGEFFIPGYGGGKYWPIWPFIAAPCIGIPIFIKSGMYRSIVHLMEIKALWTIFKSVSLVTLIWGIALLLVEPHGVPRSSILNFWLLSLLFISGSRMWARWWLMPNAEKKYRATKIAIYGAGAAGMQLNAALLHSSELFPVAFIDDASELHGHEVAGLDVYSAEDIAGLIDNLGVQQVLIAIPSASLSKKRIIVEQLEAYPVEVRMLPGLTDIAQGKVNISDIREVSIDDLLGRDAVIANHRLLERNIIGKTVMVTGAGGSIGSELCRQILKISPLKLVLFEQNEYALYAIENELTTALNGSKVNGSKNKVDIIPILGSVVHKRRVEHVCKAFNVQTIYHAAAYKHVPLVEYNPIEAVQNNIFGTWHTVQASIASGVETFVLVSTDKAVRPTNVMGATKRFAELLLQALADKNHKTRLCMVRFGNVLGSSGSVVPLFRRQIKNGGPVTVTHPEITRYFMTIPEAAQLVIQAGAMGKGGDVFVLDMGEPVKIVDLASKLIHLSGLSIRDSINPEGDIEIAYSGLRPGEKLYEELLIGDHVSGTEHALIMRSKEECLSITNIQSLLDELSDASHRFDVSKVRELLKTAVSGYQPQCDIQDLTFRAEVAELSD